MFFNYKSDIPAYSCPPPRIPFSALQADRLASRILGMGDVVSLVKKAQQKVSEEDALKTMRRGMVRPVPHRAPRRAPPSEPTIEHPPSPIERVKEVDEEEEEEDVPPTASE